MPFQLRRGTDAERNAGGGIVFLEGELVYITDTEEVYVGDGVTPGGIRVTGSSLGGSPAALTQNLNMNGYNITGTGNINITGTVTADLTGNLVGNVNGTVVGDVIGSLFSDDSTPIIDSINRVISIPTVDSSGGNLTLQNNGIVVISNETTTGVSNLSMRSKDQVASFGFTKISDSDLSLAGPPYGKITWNREDVNGTRTVAGVFGGPIGLSFIYDSDGNLPISKAMYLGDTGLAIGKATATAKLDVEGDVVVSGTISGAAFRGTVVADDSTILVDGVNGTIPGYISIATLQSIAASSATYADFQAAIALL